MKTSDVPALFSSKRERRLWTWAFVVVIAIYSTLGLTAKLVGWVNEGILAAAFLACLILVGVTILTQGLRVRPGGMEIGVAAGIAVVYVLLGVRMAIPERSHLMEYGVLAVLVYDALIERATNGRRVVLPAACAFSVTSLVGVIDECIQAFLPSRVFDWRDILFNVLTAFAAVAGMVALRWARNRTGTIRQHPPIATEQCGEPEPPITRKSKS